MAKGKMMIALHLICLQAHTMQFKRCKNVLCNISFALFDDDDLELLQKSFVSFAQRQTFAYCKCCILLKGEDI